jgi:hypothetical protein
MVDRTRITIMPATVHGIDVNGNPEPQKSTSNAVHVLDVAQHPGEDSTLDRTFGGSKCSGAYISTATTTTVKSGAGMLHAITLTETAAGTITVYDNTAGSGTVKAALKASIAEGTYIFDITFATGLTIVTAGASKLTVSYL